MKGSGKKHIRTATVIYWLMFIYMIAALAWWFISLEKQSSELAKIRYEELAQTMDRAAVPLAYNIAFNKITQEQRRDTVKHLSEGLFFLALIVISAILVFRMVLRQFRLQQQQQNFMMAVTHELKTPIAIARLNLETMQKHDLEEEKRKKLIRTTLEETARLNSLTNNILVSSQLEGGGYNLAKEELDLSALLDNCLQDFRKRFPDQKFIDRISPDMEVEGDALLLEMLINNLVENAWKYSLRGNPITVSLYKETGNVLMSIADEGVGIPDEEKKKIFQKFYRIGSEATRHTKGTGLGLYLCNKIARDHNADITVTNNSPAGSIFTVEFRR